MKKINSLIILILLFTTPLFGQNKLSGGGDLNPDLKVPYEAQQKWLDLRVGLSVHWGPSSLGGKEIGWSRHKIIPTETYDAFYKSFNPVNFDADEWCELMKRWGVRYIAPTAKHHDGFALWFSDYSEYDMENAGRKIDIMAELKRACEKHDIVLGAYYSNLDWFHPDWIPYNYGGPGNMFPIYEDTPNLDRYFKYMENQVTELIKKYDIDFVQFDGEWDSTYTHEIGSKLYRVFHEVKPDILLNTRIDIGREAEGQTNHLYMDGSKYCGDFQDRERVVNYGNNVTEWSDDAWQAWVTIDKSQWAYTKTPNLMTATELIEDAISVLGNNGNYMINVAPKPDGSFEENQIALMDTLGMWLNKYEKAIYGTRGGPYYPFAEGVSTRKGNKAWLFILDRDIRELKLPTLPQKIKNAIVFGSKQIVKYDDSKEVTTFQLPQSNGEIRVVELKFNENVVMGKKQEMPHIFEQNNCTRLTEGVSVKLSSDEDDMTPKQIQLLVEGEGKPTIDYAFHTEKEKNPYVILDLGKEMNVSGLIVYNREQSHSARAENLNIWLSSNGNDWKHQWKSDKLLHKWTIPFYHTAMGANVLGLKARFVKIGLIDENPNYLHLPRVEVYVK